MTTLRGTCTGCGQPRQLTTAGLIRSHRIRTTVCGGSFKYPAEAALRAEIAQWQRRATRAEGAMRHALWMSPLAYNNETAEEMTTRFRLHIEATYPDLVTRYSHQPVEVYQWADGCSCLDDGSNEYENAHSETDDNGDAICSRTPLGRVCDNCEDEDGDGPDWCPDRVEWPCPPIAELNQLTDAGVLAAAMTPTPAPASCPAD